MTTYKILFKDGNTWKEWEKLIDAASANAAIRLAINGVTEPNEGGTLVATPARSWRPVTVKIERTVKIG